MKALDKIYSSKIFKIVLIIINVFVVLGSFYPIMLYYVESKKMQKEQNEITIKNIALANAESAYASFGSRERALRNICNFQNKNESVNTVSYFVDYVKSYYTLDIYDFQLLDETYNGYYITNTPTIFEEYNYEVFYDEYTYKELHSLCNDLSSGNYLDFGYTREFTNQKNCLRSFAFYGHVRLYNGENVLKNYLLLAVMSSDEMIDIIQTNNNFSDLKGAVIDNNGNFIVSNLLFYTNNIYDYFCVNNDIEVDKLKADTKDEKDLGKLLFKDVLGEENNFTYARVRDSDLLVIVAVPLSSYETRESKSITIYGAVAIIAFVFLLDIFYLGIVNRKLEQVTIQEITSNNSKTDFLSRMSHDIRTPINGIVGMLEIANNSMDDKEKLKDSLDKIKLSSTHLLSLINNILDISKLEREDYVVKQSSLDLRVIVDTCVSIIKPQVEEKGLKLYVNIQKDMHTYVFGSELYTRQLIINLLSNAIKYNKPRGSIEVTLEESHVIEDKVTIKLTIEDTGIGMSEEYQKHIFEPFTQANDDVRTKFGGTGLGMAIVKKIVDKMDGSISVQSKENIGTKFIIFLPFQIDYNYRARFKQIVPVNNVVNVEGMKVLLVEDNEINIEIAKYVLEDKGIIVEVAKDGKEAIEVFNSSKINYYDVVLMDIMMPRMNGYEATKAIRSLAREDAKTMTIIAMTANVLEDDIEKVFVAGMNDFISKPIDINKVIQTLGKYRK